MENVRYKEMFSKENSTAQEWEGNSEKVRNREMFVIKWVGYREVWLYYVVSCLDAEHVGTQHVLVIRIISTVHVIAQLHIC